MRTAGVAAVYNLTVDGEHEYFAGGLLVHNCDAGLYGYVESPAFAEKPLPGPPPPNPAAGTVFESMYERRREPVHPGMRGAFGIGRFVRR